MRYKFYKFGYVQSIKKALYLKYQVLSQRYLAFYLMDLSETPNLSFTAHAQ